MKLSLDQNGQRIYETGVNQDVLYPQNSTGNYPFGVPWNGLVSVLPFCVYDRHCTAENLNHDVFTIFY